MRLSVITDEISPDLDSALRECEAMGISTVELRSVGGRNLVHQDRTAASRARAALAAGGFTCPVVDTPFLKTPIDEVAWPDLDRGFEIAHLVGAGTVRIFSGLRAANGQPVPVATIVDPLAEALAKAGDAGLRLALEIEHTCTIATGAQARELLGDAALYPLGLVWDPGNEAHFLSATPDPGPIADLRTAIFHVHVKDADPAAWVRLGTGIVDWPAQLAALVEIGYQGTCPSRRTTDCRTAAVPPPPASRSPHCANWPPRPGSSSHECASSAADRRGARTSAGCTCGGYPSSGRPWSRCTTSTKREPGRWPRCSAAPPRTTWTRC